MATNTEGLNPCDPCAHCGCHLPTINSDLTDPRRHTIKCDDCPERMEFYSSSLEQAIAAWNRRPTAQASEAIRNAALEEAAKVAERPYQIFSIGGSLIMDSNQTEAIAKAIRALSTMPVEPVTNHHDAIQPEVVDAYLAIKGQS